MKYWKKLNGLKTWQWSAFGAFVGLLISLYIWATTYLSFKIEYTPWNPIYLLATILIFPVALILIFVFGIFGLLSSDPWGPEGLAIIALYLAPIFYIGIGALVGYFIGRHKNQKKVRAKHK